MRVAHLIESHTVYTDRLASAQAAMGHEVKVVCFGNRVGRPFRPYGLVEIRVPRWLKAIPYSHHWSGMKRVLSVLRDMKPDIVHGHYVSTASLYAMLSLTGRKVLSAIGSDVLIDTRATHARVLIRLTGLQTVRYLSASYEITLALQRLGIRKDRIRTVPMGVDLSLFRRGVIPAVAPGRPLYISTRALEPVYRPDRLVRAMPSIIKEIPTSRLLFVGDGSLRAILEELASKLGVGNSVVFAGSVPHGEMPRLLAAADVYVSASVSDGTSTSLLEAMAMGCMPVVTDIPGNRPWIQDGDNGLLAPPVDTPALAETILRAVRDDALRARAASRNPAIIAERAGWQKTLDQIERTYVEALAE